LAGLIIHEWIERAGGAEKVLRAMGEAYPEAEMFCLWNDVADSFKGRNVQESWLARTPLRKRKAAALPMMPTTWRHLSIRDRDYDWVLISSHLFAHHARVLKTADAVQHVYVHTPARYIWTPELDVRGSSLPARLASPALRKLDRKRAQEPGQLFAANSRFVAARIEKAWGVPSEVIHPPVAITKLASRDSWYELAQDNERRLLDLLPGDFLLGASRFVPYKRLDQVIRLGAAVGLPVVIAGSGPEEHSLRSLARNLRVPVIFAIGPSDAMLYELYRRAHAYLFPPVEDFGIMPIESMALGGRVIVNAVGGTAESVADGVSGAAVHDFDDLTELSAALERVGALQPRIIQRSAEQFSTEAFTGRLEAWLGASTASAARPDPSRVQDSVSE